MGVSSWLWARNSSSKACGCLPHLKGEALLSYKQKHEQASKEALVTVVALAITIAVWCICGFGLAGLDIQVFHTPLWVIGGTLGTWVCSIVIVVVLSKKFFVDFGLDEEAVSPVEGGDDD